MNIVKRWNDSKPPHSPKRRYPFWNNDSFACAVLASLLGTYLDLFFVGTGLYRFPGRVLPEIFPINIVFTLLGLPAITFAFLYVISRLNPLGRIGLTLCVSLFMASTEQFAERLGAFAHSDKWLHGYSFFGYFLFLSIVSGVYSGLRRRRRRSDW